MQARQKNLRRIVDIGMTVLLLLQMAYQVLGEAAHEWLGMAMTALVIVHQMLNRRWYGAMLKGRYTGYRVASACVNVLLLISFALTAFCGMAMSNYAVPFLYGIVRVSFVRVTSPGVATPVALPGRSSGRPASTCSGSSPFPPIPTITTPC